MRALKFWEQMRGQPRDLWILFIATVINRAGTMVVPFLVLYLTRQLHFKVSQAGLVLALYGIGAMITAPMSGMLCDRYGAHRILKLSLFLSSICLALFPLAHRLSSVVGMTLLLAFTTEMFRPASASLVTSIVAPDQRRTGFSIFRQAVNIGMSIGPAIGGFLAGISFLYIFVIDAATSLAGGIIAAAMLHAKTETHSAHTSAKILPNPADSAWKNPTFVFFWISLIPVLITFFQHISAMPLYMVQELKLSEASYGLTFTFNTILVILFEVPLNVSTAHWSPRRSLSLGCLLVAIGFGSLLLAKNIWSVIATVTIWTVGEMILFPGCSAYVAEIAPKGKQGQYMGFYTMAFSVAFTIGPWLGTLLMDRYGSTSTWLTVFLFGLVSAILMSRITAHESNLSQV
jgi:MFS family permease